MLVVDWNCADLNRNFVPSFVMDKSAGFRRTRGLDGSRHRTFFTTELASGMIAMEEWLTDARFSDNFMAAAAGYPLCTVAPDN
jgi:hypothetical protein